METINEFLSEHGCYSVVSESAGDYILPDYNTDVKRLLLTRACAVNSAAYPSADGLDASGVVNYEVVYLDSENEITSCSFSTDFEVRMRCDADSFVGALANTRVAAYTVRLTGPRKFSVKAQLVTDAHITERSGMTVDGGAVSLEGAQLKMGTAAVAARKYAEPKQTTRTEEVARLDGVIADDVSVLYTDCMPRVEASVSEKGVELSGELHLRTLIKREGEIPEVIEQSYPFSELLEIDVVAEGAAVNPLVCIPEVRVTVDPTEDGVVLMAALTVESAAAVVCNEMLSVVLDCYLTDREVTNSYGEMSYVSHVCAPHSECEVELSIPRDEIGAADVRDIILMSALCKPDELKNEGESVTVRGIMRLSGVACEINEADELGFTAVKGDRPFEVNVKCGCHLPDGARIVCTPTVRSVTPSVNDTEVCVKIGLTIALDVSRTCRMTRLVSSIPDGEEITHDGVTVSVYYPAAGESLYDVGRRYHTPVMSIAADNSLTEEVFASSDESLATLGVKRLIIR